MKPLTISAAFVRRVVASALEEDLGKNGDLTGKAVVPATAMAVGKFIARGPLTVSGLPFAREVFRQSDRRLRFETRRADGEKAAGGEEIAEVRGPARAILAGERTALNFLMRASGIASAARAAVEEIRGTGATILDTRKTAPGLRALDKYAVACGGATNHRIGLFDAVMIKDTHLAVTGSITEAVRRARAAGHPKKRITVEVATVVQMEEALTAGAGRVLLDNMDLPAIRECVRKASGRIVLEASGGLRPGRLGAVASTGVDYLSVGWLTHSAPAADLALDVEVLP